MMKEIKFDYFRGTEADKYSFYRIPKVLFTEECFSTLSCEAKVLYGLMLDRMSLSLKNHWFDEEKRAYIIFTVEDVMELLNCCRQKAIKNMSELDAEKGIGLIEKKRLGLGKPNVIYVKNFMIIDENGNPSFDGEAQESFDDLEENSKEEAERITSDSFEDVQKYENHTSRSMQMEAYEPTKNVDEIYENPDKTYANQGLRGIEVEPQGDSKSDFKKYENQTSRSMEIRLQEVRKSDFKKYENQTSGSMEIRLPEVRKSESNNTNINNTNYSETEYSNTEYSETNLINQNYKSNPINQDSREAIKTMDTIDAIDKMNAYREIVRENISYECYAHEQSYVRSEIDELVELIVEVMMMSDDKTVRIAGENKPVPIVKNQFMKLTYAHIEYVRFCLDKNTSKVGNIKAYLLTTLYNSLITIDHFYQAEVKHDMYGGV